MPGAIAHTGAVPNATPATAPTAVASATFTVPSGTVWAYRLDIANLSEYNPDVSDVVRVSDGSGDDAGDVCGPGARYTFALTDPRRPGVPQPIELWIVEAVAPTLVTAAMSGGSDAYEEFVVRPLADGGCQATLTLWVTLPGGLSDEVVAGAAAGSLASIRKELRLMKQVLEGNAESRNAAPRNA
jgi:Polyketide cyclase / dehydrase and lipid transport